MKLINQFEDDILINGIYILMNKQQFFSEENKGILFKKLGNLLSNIFEPFKNSICHE